MTETDSDTKQEPILRDVDGNQIEYSTNGPTPEDEAWAREVGSIACSD